MFAPRVAKSQAKRTADPTNGRAHQHQKPVEDEQARMLQATIGNQVMPRNRTQRLSNLAVKTSEERQGHEADPRNVTAQEAPRGSSWDFSKIPVFLPERADRPQAPSPLAATQQAREPYEKSQLTPAQDSDVARDVPTATIHEAVQSPGQSVHLGARAFMERRFGQDNSNVRIDTDREAAERTADFGARAFTLGDHILLGANKFAGQTRPGRKPAAHEWAHVAQNRSGNPSAQTLEPTSADVEAVSAEPVRRGHAWDFAATPLHAGDTQAKPRVGGIDEPSRHEAGWVADQVLRMAGEPLEPGVRREAERRFGRDFGNVRVHRGPKAVEAVAVVGAPAFTLGRHIVAQDGASDPTTPEGHAILSHELTHVVQQAAFNDHNLAGAPVLDATHSSEQEARAGTAVPSPLAAPAIQRAPPDIAMSGQQLEIDLTKSSWRHTLDFEGGQTQIVYALRDATTGEFLKVGKTTVRQIADRFGEYVAAGNKWSRKLVADVWTLRARSAKNVEAFEAQIRAGLEKAGARLPWDNTRVPKKGPRLGRPGQGIPDTKPQTETEFIDEVEQLRVRHAPPNIPKRRGMSSKEKAKLKATEEKAAADASAKAAQDTQQAATKVSSEAGQTAGKAGTQAGGDGALPPPAGPTKAEPIPAKPATSELKGVSDSVTATQPKVEMPPVGGSGAGATSTRLGLEASRLRMAGRFLAEEAPGLLLQAMLMLLFPPEVHIHDENYPALSSQQIDPALQTALTEQAATLNKLAADDAAQSIWATVTVELDFSVEATSHGDLEVYLQDLRFIEMKITREYLLVEGEKFDLGKGRPVSKTVTYSVPIFGPATHGSEGPIRDFRRVRESLTAPGYKVRMSAMLSMYKMANANPFLTNQLIRDLQGMRNDDNSTVRDVAAHLLSRLKPER